MLAVHQDVQKRLRKELNEATAALGPEESFADVVDSLVSGLVSCLTSLLPYLKMPCILP